MPCLWNPYNMKYLYIIYCGGCRSGYDRTIFVNELTSIIFDCCRTNIIYDVKGIDCNNYISLIICGCSSMCLVHTEKSHVVTAVDCMDGMKMNIHEMAEILCREIRS